VGTAGRPAARTWAPWYRDWMTGRLRPVSSPADATTARAAAEAGPIGLTRERWALRASPDDGPQA
jgi:hypothetical protein